MSEYRRKDEDEANVRKEPEQNSADTVRAWGSNYYCYYFVKGDGAYRRKQNKTLKVDTKRGEGERQGGRENECLRLDRRPVLSYSDLGHLAL